MTLHEMPFDRPFLVRMQGGLERLFNNAYDALDFLENEWPLRHGPCYSRAVETCRKALAGEISCRAARAALLAACLEAGLDPVSESPRSGGSRKRAA